MTCRTAWAGEQLQDVEAGTPVATVSRARCGSVAGITRVQSDLGSTPGHSFDCRNRGLELVVPALAKSLSRQRHIDVRFYALAFDDGAAPGVPAGGREPQNESMTDRKVAAAKHLAARAGSDDPRQGIL